MATSHILYTYFIPELPHIIKQIARIALTLLNVQHTHIRTHTTHCAHDLQIHSSATHIRYMVLWKSCTIYNSCVLWSCTFSRPVVEFTREPTTPPIHASHPTPHRPSNPKCTYIICTAVHKALHFFAQAEAYIFDVREYIGCVCG